MAWTAPADGPMGFSTNRAAPDWLAASDTVRAVRRGTHEDASHACSEVRPERQERRDAALARQDRRHTPGNVRPHDRAAEALRHMRQQPITERRTHELFLFSGTNASGEAAACPSFTQGCTASASMAVLGVARNASRRSARTGEMADDPAAAPGRRRGRARFEPYPTRGSTAPGPLRSARVRKAAS